MHVDLVLRFTGAACPGRDVEYGDLVYALVQLGDAVFSARVKFSILICIEHDYVDASVVMGG